jgi:tetratricopeptide (TPR) repeat protein
MSPCLHLLSALFVSLAVTAAVCPVVGAAEVDAAETAAADALASKATYEQRISELENRSAPYDSQLSEAYLSLGATLQTLEQHEQALEALGKAMQALRISNGLYDTQQIPVLQQQMASHTALQQWEELDAAYHLVNYIAQKQFKVGDRQRFDALVQLGRWKMKAAVERLLTGNTDEAAVAAELYRKEISRLAAAGASADSKLQLATLYFDLAAAEFQQVQTINQLPLAAWESSSRSTTTQMQCVPVRLPDGRVSQVCTAVEVPNVSDYLISSQRKGQELGMHLEAMRTAVMDGYYALQDTGIAGEQRNQLLPEMQRLTSEYNEFINDNTTAANPRLQP